MEHPGVTGVLDRRRLFASAVMVSLLALVVAACGGGEPAAEPDVDVAGEQPTAAEEAAESDPAPAEDGADDDPAPAGEDPGVSFEGETLRFVVGFSAGGGFDAVARLIAERLPEELEGNPTVVVQNMPGASSLVAANTVYQMQPGDGRTIVMMHFGVVLDQILGSTESEFDAFEWIWLGEPAGETDPGIVYVHDDLGIETMEDLRDHGETLYVGTQNRTAPTTMIIEHLSRAGWPVEMIYGYPGTSELDLAFDQRELDVGSAGAALTLANDDLMSRVNVLGSLGTNGWFQEQGVPDLHDRDYALGLGLSEADHDFIEFLYSARSHVRLFAVSPGTPPEQVDALRGAFEAVLTDPETMEQVEAMGLIPGYTDGDAIASTVASLIGSSPDAVSLYHEYAEETD